MNKRTACIVIFIACLVIAVFHHQLHVSGWGMAAVVIGALISGLEATDD